MKRFEFHSAKTEITVTPSCEFLIYVEYLHRKKKEQWEYGMFNLTTECMESCPEKPEWALQGAVSAKPDTRYPGYFIDHIYTFVRDLWQNAQVSFSRKVTLKELWNFWDIIILDERDRPGVSYGTANLPIHKITCPDCGKTVTALVEITKQGRLLWIPVKVEES